MIIQQIIEQIKENHTFLVVAHENPDGDAIGSTLALALALKEMGKEVVAYNADHVPETMSYLHGSDSFTQELAADAQFDVAFVLDAGEIKRTKIAVQQLSKQIINVDHHPHSTFGDLCYLDTTASATAVLIYRILTAYEHTISEAVAAALYLGILSDTGSFRYSSANEEAFNIAAKLVARGLDPWDTASNLYESYAPERMRLLGAVLPSLTISKCGRYAMMFMTKQDLVAADALAEHADGFVNYPRAIRGVEVALFFNEVDHEDFKISLRSRGNIDVGYLAHQLNGGGHHNAAGARISGTQEEAKNIVTGLLDKILN